MRQTPPSAVPIELRLTPQKTALLVVWDDGARSSITAAALRQGCRCASCTAARALGRPVTDRADIVIEAVAPIGGYAVNLAFSDGHARGIYPWALLRDLAPAPPQPELSPGPAQTADPAARS